MFCQRKSASHALWPGPRPTKKCCPVDLPRVLPLSFWLHQDLPTTIDWPTVLPAVLPLKKNGPTNLPFNLATFFWLHMDLATHLDWNTVTVEVEHIIVFHKWQNLMFIIPRPYQMINDMIWYDIIWYDKWYRCCCRCFLINKFDLEVLKVRSMYQ